MANIRKRGSVYTVQIRRKGEQINFTEDTEERAVKRARELEDAIDRGRLPSKYRQVYGESRITLATIIRDYIEKNTIGVDNTKLLNVITAEFGGSRLTEVNYSWAEEYIEFLKKKGLSPGTIRKYKGVIQRCLDWAVAKNYLLTNPFSMLPSNYSSGALKEDQERTRRLSEAEERLIREYLGTCETYEPHLLMFDMALETAMRLREMYTLTWGQIDLDKRTVFLDKTKNGSKRQVPLSSVMLRLLEQRDVGLVFPWWDGELSKENLVKTTNRLSRMWCRIFEKLEIYDLGIHDLRHEATSRIYERTTLSDIQIAKITGHKTLRTLMRYANLRGSDLAAHLW